MKYRASFLCAILLLGLPACRPAGPVCPEATGTPQYLTVSPADLPAPTPGSGPVQVEVGGKTIQVDRLVEGPLCHDTWSGTVYVSCRVQVMPWEEHPTFLKGCALNIEPGTVVYVAYHNDAAYYNGCSCHTGVTGEP